MDFLNRLQARGPDTARPSRHAGGDRRNPGRRDVHAAGRAWLAGVVSLLALLPPLAARAAPPPAQDAAVQQVLRKAQGALRQLSEDKAKLEADAAALQKDKAAAEDKASKLEARLKELEPLPGELQQQKAAAEALKNANSGLEGRLGDAAAKHAQLRGKLKDIVAQAKKIQGDNQLLVEAVKEREQWIARCGQKNANLAEAHGELVRRYEDKGFLEVLRDAEPLTGIGRVQTENAAQDYRFKLQDLQATPFESQIPPAQEDAARQARPKAPAEDDDEE